MQDSLTGRIWRNATLATDPASGEPSSFLQMLYTLTRPDDFVVVKVDMDGGPEQQVVRAISEVPELASRVDELFFEIHFYDDKLPMPWDGYATLPPPPPPSSGGSARSDSRQPRAGSIDAALRLLKALRLAGVRSHFWV